MRTSNFLEAVDGQTILLQFLEYWIQQYISNFSIPSPVWLPWLQEAAEAGRRAEKRPTASNQSIDALKHNKAQQDTVEL
jgi:hypothetical protein